MIINVSKFGSVTRYQTITWLSRVVHQPELDHSGPIQSDRPLTNGGRIIRSGRLRSLHSFRPHFNENFIDRWSSSSKVDWCRPYLHLWRALNRTAFLPEVESSVRCNAPLDTERQAEWQQQNTRS